MKAAKPLSTPTTYLSNSFCTVSYDLAENSISGRDLTDHNNLPAFYSDKKRGVKNAWLKLVEEFGENTSFSGASDILKSLTSIHSYCRMD